MDRNLTPASTKGAYHRMLARLRAAARWFAAVDAACRAGLRRAVRMAVQMGKRAADRALAALLRAAQIAWSSLKAFRRSSVDFYFRAETACAELTAHVAIALFVARALIVILGVQIALLYGALRWPWMLLPAIGFMALVSYAMLGAREIAHVHSEIAEKRIPDNS